MYTFPCTLVEYSTQKTNAPETDPIIIHHHSYLNYKDTIAWDHNRLAQMLQWFKNTHVGSLKRVQIPKDYETFLEIRRRDDETFEPVPVSQQLVNMSNAEMQARKNPATWGPHPIGPPAYATRRY